MSISVEGDGPSKRKRSHIIGLNHYCHERKNKGQKNIHIKYAVRRLNITKEQVAGKMEVMLAAKPSKGVRCHRREALFLGSVRMLHLKVYLSRAVIII